MTTIVEYTQKRSSELAVYLQAVAGTSLSFDGQFALEHSSHNHVHLWKLEYLADTFDWIDVDYRVEFVKYIFEQWRRRLKGMAPYAQRGYRLYVYEDLAPTVSVVAETDRGCPYRNGVLVFTETIRDVVRLYADRSWKEHFSAPDWTLSEELILGVIKKKNGSIGKPSAQQLGIPVGKLRSLITNMGLTYQVNELRKRFHRRPADFSNELADSERWHIFERVLPVRYR